MRGPVVLGCLLGAPDFWKLPCGALKFMFFGLVSSARSLAVLVVEPPSKRKRRPDLGPFEKDFLLGCSGGLRKL